MRNLGFLLVLLAVLVSFPQISEARKDNSIPGHTTFVEKLFTGQWTDKIWEGYNFEPYLGDQTIKNRILWDRDNWTPQAWIDDAGGDPRRILQDLYEAHILIDQRKDGGIPVLVVGEPYMRLSSTDRIRILRFVDYVFQITNEPNGMYFVYFSEVEDAPLGTFDKRGFQQY